MSHGTDDNFTVYIITNKGKTMLYIGITNNIERRMLEHKTERNVSFASKFNINQLMYFEHFKYPNIAIKREKQLKKWNDQWKRNLVNSFNPSWKDLAGEWFTKQDLEIKWN